MSNVANIVANGIAPPMYLVDANGNPISSTNALAVSLNNGANQLKVNADGSVLANINNTAFMSGGDAVAASGFLEFGIGLYNGTTADRQRGNLDNITLLTSTAITTNTSGADQTNYNHRGIKLFLNTGTFGSGASAITVTLQGKDPVSGQYYTILQSASLTASAFTVLSVYPGLAVTANVSANDVLPRSWRVTWQATAWGTGGSTLGIACALIL